MVVTRTLGQGLSVDVHNRYGWCMVEDVQMCLHVPIISLFTKRAMPPVSLSTAMASLLGL
jgi:hypothetical protein